ncbi:MAG: CCA-adding enzyme [Candidatus Syntrophoarchaeum sp. GoM_oil]|nr:MAG: CCA-adding enzyme [Candidatus Syntrophoarchaeum sp. GoM_oil]
MEEILKEVLKRVKPEEAEIKRLDRFSRFITKKVRDTAEALSIEIEVILVGSAARSTWVSGEHDVDLFILFDPSEVRAELELNGIEIGKRVVGDDYTNDEFYCISHEKEYAEHPYIKAVFGSGAGSKYDVDIVPCFAVHDPSKIESAVDRTPFHNRYIISKIGGLEDEVLLLKQFMKGIGVYGSELRRRGFSGYLTELLVINYGSFLGVLKEASNIWKKGMLIDIESHGTYEEDDPLVVIDPVDPMRNVAAALSIDNFSRFIDEASMFLADPAIEFFFPPPIDGLEQEEFISILRERGTKMLFVVFDAPPLVEDIIFPQLRRSGEAAVELLQREGFRVYKKDEWADDEHAVILLELEVSELPHIKKHPGPPVWSRKHAPKFKLKHADAKFGIYIEDGRYAVDIERRYTYAGDFLNAKLRETSLGKNLKNAQFRIIEAEKIIDTLKLKEEFKEFLRAYLS